MANRTEYKKVNRKVTLRNRLLFLFEDIARSPDGVNKLRVVGTVNLVAQPANSGLDDVCLRIEIVIPDMFHNHRFRYNPSRIAHQVFQQGELARLQIDLVA